MKPVLLTLLQVTLVGALLWGGWHSMCREPVFVELDAVVQSLEFRVLPPANPVEPWRTLLDEGVRVTEVNWRGVRVGAVPGSGATLADPRLELKSAVPFDSSLEVRAPATLKVEWLGPGQVTVGIAEADSAEPRLRGQVHWSQDLQIKGEELNLPPGWSEQSREGEWTSVPKDRAGFLLINDGGDTSVRLELASSRPPPSRRVWELSAPRQGQGLGAVNEHTLGVPESAIPIAVGERLLFVDAQAAKPDPPEPLLSAIEVVNVELWRQYLDHPESFVVAGKLRFPDSTRREIELGPRYLLDLKPQARLYLRSLEVGEDGLHLLLSGDARVYGGYDSRPEIGPRNLEIWYMNEALNWVIAVAGTLAVSEAGRKMLERFFGGGSGEAA